MTDKLIRLSDVLALLPETDEVGPKPSALRKAIEELPGWVPSQSVESLNVDAVEVVRCRDCKFWDNGDCYRLELSRPDDYCSYGERRDNIK